MFWNTLLQPLLLAAAVAPAASARRGPNGLFGLAKSRPVLAEGGLHDVRRRAAMQDPPLELKKRADFQFLNANTSRFAVNGTGIPDVDFDIGESYAGSLPVSADPDDDSLFFWFFPSTNPAASKEIVIWLNGGPGCSSLEGLLQENGPFLWQSGTLKPVKNTWSWNKLSNMVYVDQPVGTGFSVGDPTQNTSEEQTASQFLGFWKNFIETFSMQGYKVFITGESYGGFYCPYIASAMLDAKDETYYNMSGLMIYDPVIGPFEIQESVPVVAFVDYWKGLFPLNDSFVADIHARAEFCGYNDYMNKYLVFPPSGPQPEIFAGFYSNGSSIKTCEALWQDIYHAVSLVNPCFDVYQVATTCPLPWDVLGFPGSFDYLPDGASIYFQRDEVKTAIHAPKDVNWTACSAGVLDVDTSQWSSFTVLPKVIDATQNVIIGQGALDYIILTNGTLLSIQNMTWGGQLGFQALPTDPLFVPFHHEPSQSAWGGSGVLGTVHTERGLTFADIAMSGHMVPQYQPTVAFRQLEFLLGRVSSLSSVEPFTTDKNETEPSPDALGSGNAHTVDQPISNGTVNSTPTTVVTSAGAAVSAVRAGLLMASLGLAMLVAM